MNIWAIRVGLPSNGYIMDNRVFDTKREAVAYKKKEGYGVAWTNHWHVVKLQEVVR